MIVLATFACIFLRSNPLVADWHLSKKVTTFDVFVFQLGKSNAMRKIQDWSPHIVKHFWHCASTCRKDDSTTDEEALKIMKVYFCENTYCHHSI